jgi:3-oxoacyl-[acyl-carrier-protein] synthase-1
LRQVYIERYGICSALGGDLSAHTKFFDNDDLTPPVDFIHIQETADDYVVPYYKAKDNLDGLIKSIGKLPANTTLFIGSSSLGVQLNEQNYVKEGIKYLGYDLEIPALCKKLGANSCYYVFNTACTSSANALIYAARMIKENMIENALVLGIEVQNMLSQYGFMSLGLISKEGIKPFDKHRSGIVLGEASGFALLSSKKSSWEFAEGGISNDISNITTPSKDGETLQNIIKNIIHDANIKTSQIDLIKLHATASDSNDISENSAIYKVFGDSIPSCVALKGYIGHTLGACGVCELALLLNALDNGFVPKSLGFDTQDDNFQITPTTQKSAWRGKYVLFNYLAFGGNITSFLIKKDDK